MQKIKITRKTVSRVQRIMHPEILAILTMVYKGLYNMATGYITSLLKERSQSAYDLRGKRKLQIPVVKTTTFGLHSFKYRAASPWNS